MTSDAEAHYRSLVAFELAEAVDPRVTAMAMAIAALHADAAQAVLFYGSCLRASPGEDALAGQMLDFYLIVSGYREAYGPGWKALANRLLPPNVFPFVEDGLAAKYAVLSEADFARLCRSEANNVSVWARFAQPSRLAWARDAAARDAAIAAVAEAGPTLFALTLPTLSPSEADDPLIVWRHGFALTYAAELRAERIGRNRSIVDHDPARYARFGMAARAVLAEHAAAPTTKESLQRRASGAASRRWRGFQRRGKLLTLARLAKASTTFAGGLDYLAWKINRHAGTTITIKPWQRRLPLLGAVALLPRLLAKGAVR